ncbi:hypothetical protein EYF80_011592 [Liparis tanakae]|uniref:Uncharacterized protein n=1 Tax=Liparis tanakae TaxID=230148 RepID=A0A4Z2IJX0_9TELE|nr:hypothetical protein EYF80_011592 [Liparis tanakae]
MERRQREGKRERREGQREGWTCEVTPAVNIYEFLAAFSLLGELGEEEDEDEGEKCIPDNPGGSVAVFCPLRLFLHTGHEVDPCFQTGSITTSGKEHNPNQWLWDHLQLNKAVRKPRSKVKVFIKDPKSKRTIPRGKCEQVLVIHVLVGRTEAM